MFDYRVTLNDGVMHHFKSESANALQRKVIREYPGFAIKKIQRIRVSA